MSFEEMSENAKAPSLPTEFKFEESPVRVVMKADQPWFVTKDVCDILGIANPRDAIADFDDDEKGVVKTDTPGGPQDLTKPYTALALDLAGKPHRRHDQALEAGLSSHNRVEKAQAWPDAGKQMKAAYEVGLAREAFARQRGALDTLADVAFERLKQAADLIAERAKAVAGAFPLRADPVGPAEPQPPSPPSSSPNGPSP